MLAKLYKFPMILLYCFLYNTLNTSLLEEIFKNLTFHGYSILSFK